MQTRLRSYVSTVAVAAIAAALGVYHVAASWDVASTKGAFVLAALGVLTALLGYKMPRGGSASIALVPFIASALVAPGVAAVLAIALAQATIELVNRRPLIKSSFNIAQAVLAVSLGVLVYLVLGGQALALDGSFWTAAGSNAPRVVALLAVFVFTNTSAVSGVISITERTGFITVWRENTLGTAAYTLVAGALGYALASVYVRWGAVGATLFVLPLVAFRQFYITTIQLQQTNRELLDLMVKAIEARDPYTSGHSRRVANAAVIIAKGIGLKVSEVERVRIAALLHDIGKIDEMYAPILRKEGKLTAAEWEIMKTHPVKSAELVSTLTDLRDIVLPVRHHHEHWNGKGYPDGIAGEAIPLAARIITFADTMDALTTDRPYRPALGESEVRAEFVKHCGTQFDPTICGHVLSPAIWAQLFPKEGYVLQQPRFSIVSNPKARAVAS